MRDRGPSSGISFPLERLPAHVPLLLPLLHQVDFETKQMGKANNSAAHINDFVEGTIERLGFTPDLYYLHRIEPGRDLNESITALQRLKENGKCKYIGLSECSAQTLRRACQGRLEYLLPSAP
jgi:aryl-alcohol dehydrogenase-like predicted oxidoreductase